jgi:tetratricopeptide (TPR) repeat protein
MNIFLCHASEDKNKVRELYRRLSKDGYAPWLDKENLLPGQEWAVEIPKVVKNSDIVIVCLSNRIETKTGYIQKEIRIALDAAEERPEGSIFIIPLRLEECSVPERLQRWHYVDYFEKKGYEKLIKSLNFLERKSKTKNATRFRLIDSQIDLAWLSTYREGINTNLSDNELRKATLMTLPEFTVGGPSDERFPINSLVVELLTTASETENIKKKVSLYQDALLIEPNDPVLCRLVAWASQSVSDYLTAIEYDKRAVSLDSYYMKAYVGIIISCNRIKKYPLLFETWKTYEQLSKYEERPFHEGAYWYAETLSDLGRIDDAKKWYNHVVGSWWKPMNDYEKQIRQRSEKIIDSR